MKNLYKFLIFFLILGNAFNIILHAKEGWFVGVQGGIIHNGPFGYQTEISYKDSANKNIANRIKAKVSDTASFGAVVGYAVDNMIFKIDGGKNNFHTKKDNTNFQYELIGLTFTTLYQFNTYSKWLPYIGGGLGIYSQKMSFKGEPYQNANMELKNNFSWHVTLGVDYDILDNIRISLEDKLMFVNGFSFGSKQQNVEYKFSAQRQLQNIISLSVQYYFW